MHSERNVEICEGERICSHSLNLPLNQMLLIIDVSDHVKAWVIL